MSKTDLAKRLNVSPTTVQYYETGRSPLSAARLLEIAQALNAPVSAFFAKSATKKLVTTSSILDLPESADPALFEQIHKLSGAYLAQSARSCDFGQLEERCGNMTCGIDRRIACS